MDEVNVRFVEQNATITDNHNQVEAKFTQQNNTINCVQTTITNKVEAQLNQQNTTIAELQTTITNNHNQVQATMQSNQDKTTQQFNHLKAQFEAFKTGMYSLF